MATFLRFKNVASYYIEMVQTAIPFIWDTWHGGIKYKTVIKGSVGQLTSNIKFFSTSKKTFLILLLQPALLTSPNLPFYGTEY